MLVEALGSVEDLKIVEMESPALIDGHVRIEILACGLNYVDALMVEGLSLIHI